MCEQQYFFEYVLGYKSTSNKKADKGTIVHKVLEILAAIKLAQQNKESVYFDDILERIYVEKYNLDHIVERVYAYYSSQFKHHEWSPKDLKDCRLWVNKAITDHNGVFDPRNQDIIKPEQRFDIQINKPWAYYDYENGMSGYLAIKGTIDLIAKANKDTIEIIDYKTGRRLDWATGEEKTFGKLEKDPQLRMYHYAASVLYPEVEHIIVSIYFINDGGIFSMNYNKDHLPETEDMIRRKFEEIKKCKRPKNTFENHNSVLPLLEYRDGQVCEKGNYMTMCEQVKHDTELNGIKSVVDNYTVSGYSVGKYKPPGSTE